MQASHTKEWSRRYGTTRTIQQHLRAQTAIYFHRGVFEMKATLDRIEDEKETEEAKARVSSMIKRLKEKSSQCGPEFVQLGE